MATLRSIILNEPVKKVIKLLLFPYYKSKWGKNSRVSEWLKAGIIPVDELRVLVYEWERFKGPFALPHALKQKTILSYQKKNNCDILIETGTFRGDMIQAQLTNFKEIYSIELNPVFWKKAIDKFRNSPQVKLLQGDSGEVMHTLIPTIKSPALFWLDGHYSGGDTAKGNLECPIYEELHAIFTSEIYHTILIDDARYFIGKRDYPTIDELKAFIKKHNKNYTLSVVEDIIVLEQ